MAEDKFEQAVIEKLKSEGRDYLSEYSGVTVDRLYDHWRDILNANNRKRLEDTPLSDNEFEQFQKYDDDGKDVTQSVNCATINHHENREFARDYYYNLSNSSTQYLIR